MRLKISILVLLFISSALPCGTSPAWGAQKSAEVNLQVLPHRWSATKLANVNRGATLEISLTIDGKATVLLVDSAEFKKFPQVSRPLFRSETSRKLNFSIVAPRNDDYFLIVDNLRGESKLKYSLKIKASLETLPKTRP